MCRIGILLGLCAIFSGFSARAAIEHPMTLDECYAGALKRSETIGNQIELIDQAEEHIKQAWGGVLPTINGAVSYGWQDVPSSLQGNEFFPSPSKSWRITGDQPLFRGFREFAGIKQTRYQKESQELAKHAAELQLYKDLSQAFYAVLSLEQDRRNVDVELDYYGKRVQELQARIRIGRSQVSEVLTVQAAAASLRAQRDALDGQIRVARETLAFLTGFERDLPLNDDRPEAPPDLPPIESFTARIDARPDVMSGLKLSNAAEEAERVAWGAHLPSADLLGNYYLPGLFRRTGIQQDVAWDLLFAVTIPIYAGGTIQSRVREVASQQRQAELQVSSARRQGNQEIRSDYESLQADFAQLKSLRTSTELNERNYKEQSREYRLGLVTNIDVLAALTSFLESQRALDRMRFTAKLDYARLGAAVDQVTRP